MRDHGPVLRERGALLKEVARLSALADDFNSERLGLKALLREQGQELADWARHWAWVTARWGRHQAYLWSQDEEGCNPDKNTKWEQWAGIVSRGMPQTLILSRLPAPLTTKRSPGPGAIRKVDWAPLAEKHLQGKQVIFHTDSAKSYLMKIKGVVHDRVVHKKTKAEVRGKTVRV